MGPTESLTLATAFPVLNPLGFFTEAVRCDNCEARCTHGTSPRTQEPNLPRAADNLHVCGLSLHLFGSAEPVLSRVVLGRRPPFTGDPLSVKQQPSGGAKQTLTLLAHCGREKLARQLDGLFSKRCHLRRRWSMRGRLDL